MNDERRQHPHYALQVRDNRWRLVVDLSSVDEAATVLERVAKGTGAVTVAVETYDPAKNVFERKGSLTFRGASAKPAGEVLRRIGREACRFSMPARLALAALAAPVFGLAVLGAYDVAVPALAPLVSSPAPAVPVAAAVPPPSRILPREWTGAAERRDIPAAFHGDWAGDCSAARINGTGTQAIAAGTLFGKPVNWVRVIGSRILVNTGPDGASVSTLIRSDGLVLYLEDRFTETVERRAERAAYTPERPAILSKCL